MALSVGARVRSVTITPDWDDGPARHADIQVEWPLRGFSDKELTAKSILVALGGPVAEMLYSGDAYHPGLVAEWASDWQLAWEAATRIVPNEKQRLAYLEQVCIEVYRLCNQDIHWATIAAIADSLEAHETLEGEEVDEIFQQWQAN